MRDVFPQQARARRFLENRLLDFLDSRGYDMVSGGTFEYVDTLLRGRTVKDSEDWIQLFDATGRAIALRPDMTPSIARMAAPLLAAPSAVGETGGNPTSIRWCYAEKVFHRTTDPASLSWLSGKAAEATQVGVECIGCSGHDADADILALCREATASLGLTEWQMVVSHAVFGSAFLQAVGVSVDQIEPLLSCLTRGDYVGFRRLAADSGVKGDVLSWLGALNPYRDTTLPDTYGVNWKASKAGRQAEEAWTYLVNLAAALRERGLDEGLTFDLTLHRDLTYYTGIVFEVFAPGVGGPIALGGRYDDLLKQFGVEAPAIGFAFEVERLLAAQSNDVWQMHPGIQHKASVPSNGTTSNKEGR